MRFTSRWARAALGVIACSTCSGSAFAHFPVSRGVAVSPGGATAVALPGFGIVLRGTAREPFAYLCDALLGVAPSDTAPALSFAADGSLLVGSASGLRSVDATGCPRADFGGALENRPLARVVVHPLRPSVVYAATDETVPRLFRSDDGGTTWTERAPLASLYAVTALVLDPADPERLYVSQTNPQGGGLLHTSRNGGTSFSTIVQKAARTLLEVEAAAGDAGAARAWAVGRSAAAVSNQGFSLFEAASPAGPWAPLVDVRFFGGFAREPGGALWIGDEAGGVYHSTDGGSSFGNVASTTGVSCLDFAAGALWGCTPGIAEQRTLVTWNDATQAFDDVVALSHVTRLASCTNVATTCAAAWVEWQRDILMLPQTPKDAGSPPSGTGGSPGTAPMDDAGVPSGTPSPEASVSPAARPSPSSGCSMTTDARTGSPTALVLAALCLAGLRRRRSNRPSRPAFPDSRRSLLVWSHEDFGRRRSLAACSSRIPTSRSCTASPATFRRRYSAPR